MVAWAFSGFGLYPLKPKLLQIQLIDEYVDNPNRVILRNRRDVRETVCSDYDLRLR
jgi:hypothetical protein